MQNYLFSGAQNAFAEAFEFDNQAFREQSILLNNLSRPCLRTENFCRAFLKSWHSFS